MVNKIILGKNLINSRSQRASIIPYISTKNSLWFLFGFDAKSVDVTDFGGGVKMYENDFDAAWREFNEETKGIFSKEYTKENLNQCVSLNKSYSKDSIMSCIFLPVRKEWYSKAYSEFNRNKGRNKHCREISQMLWVRDDEIYNLITKMSHNKLWNRLVMFYKNFNFRILKRILLQKYLN